MNKEELVKSLKNVKLIIGNGFDLHCGLHTKYSDFYCKNIDKYQHINKKFRNYKNTDEIDFESDVGNYTVWDIFFCLNSSENPELNTRMWCDIEKLMLASLLPDIDYDKEPEKLGLYICSAIHWDNIKTIFTKRIMATNHTDVLY